MRLEAELAALRSQMQAEARASAHALEDARSASARALDLEKAESARQVGKKRKKGVAVGERDGTARRGAALSVSLPSPRSLPRALVPSPFAG